MSIPRSLVFVIIILMHYSAIITRSRNSDEKYEPSWVVIVLNLQAKPKQHMVENKKHVEEYGILIQCIPSKTKRIEDNEFVLRSQHRVLTKMLSNNDRDGRREYVFEQSIW